MGSELYTARLTRDRSSHCDRPGTRTPRSSQRRDRPTMKSRERFISSFLVMCSFTCGTLAHGQELIDIPDSCSDGEDKIATPDGRIFVCDLESGEFEDFAPPTGDAMWPITIGSAYGPPSVTEQRHESWAFRAIFIIDSAGTTRAVEFDKQANILSTGGMRPAPSHLS